METKSLGVKSGVLDEDESWERTSTGGQGFESLESPEPNISTPEPPTRVVRVGCGEESSLRWEVRQLVDRALQSLEMK